MIPSLLTSRRERTVKVGIGRVCDDVLPLPSLGLLLGLRQSLILCFGLGLRLDLRLGRGFGPRLTSLPKKNIKEEEAN